MNGGIHIDVYDKLEIKDTIGAKVIDEFVPVTTKFQNTSFCLKDYLEESAWKEIGEICFTVFLEDDYVTKDTGSLEIKNCVLRPKNK